MKPLSVQVTAASRLHFGLISLGGTADRRFGGVGVMVAPPSARLRVVPAVRFSVEGAGAERVWEFANSWRHFRQLTDLPRCLIHVESLPRMHTGLGVGTQLALSVARGLEVFSQLPEGTPEQLAQSVGRGLRSAVGTHGFVQGGLIFELGKAEPERLGPLGRAVSLPDVWRFVLICPQDEQGLHGVNELRAFANLPSVSAGVSADLSAEVTEQLLPAAESGEFDRFSDSVYRFGYRAGIGFAAVQGGAYNGVRLTALVEFIRSLGIRGVGQSSWGPTLFALCPHAAAAEELVAQLRDHPLGRNTEFTISQPWNRPAQVDIEWGEDER